MELERAYLAALQDAIGVVEDADRLTFLGPDGNPVVELARET